MRAGYFGSISESDPSEVMLRSLRRIRARADALAEVQGRKGRSGLSSRSRSIQEGRPVSRCRCVVALTGPRKVTRERLCSGATLNLAIAEGLEWALHLARKSREERNVSEIAMTNLLMEGKAEATAGKPCFEWKAGRTTIEQELDRILADILTLKQREIDEFIDRFVAGELRMKLNELEEVLRKATSLSSKTFAGGAASLTIARKKIE